MSYNQLKEQYLLSRCPCKCYKETYLESIPRELFLELLKFYTDNSLYKYTMFTDIFCSRYIYLDQLEREHYHKVRGGHIPIESVSNELLMAIINNEKFTTTTTTKKKLSYYNNVLKTLYLTYAINGTGSETNYWPMTYKFFDCLVQALEQNVTKMN